ncbi:MAG: hypothetical protein LBQ66_09385 [Planctomycetaceae bacterium]|nr:hypothetical protein [Planctomycetaceae bacterium]
MGASQLYQANADDFDYQNQPDSGTYENIINFDGGDTLTIDGYSYTFGSETSPFKIFDTTGNEVSRDSIKHVNITVSDSASTSFGANGTGNANGVSESWTVVDGGSFIVDAYLVIGGIAESGNGGDGNFTVNGGTVTGSFELVLCNA